MGIREQLKVLEEKIERPGYSIQKNVEGPTVKKAEIIEKKQKDDYLSPKISTSPETPVQDTFNKTIDNIRHKIRKATGTSKEQKKVAQLKKDQNSERNWLKDKRDKTVRKHDNIKLGKELVKDEYSNLPSKKTVDKSVVSARALHNLSKKYPVPKKEQVGPTVKAANTLTARAALAGDKAPFKDKTPKPSGGPTVKAANANSAYDKFAKKYSSPKTPKPSGGPTVKAANTLTARAALAGDKAPFKDKTPKPSGGPTVKAANAIKPTVSTPPPKSTSTWDKAKKHIVANKEKYIGGTAAAAAGIGAYHLYKKWKKNKKKKK